MKKQNPFLYRFFYTLPLYISNIFILSFLAHLLIGIHSSNRIKCLACARLPYTFLILVETHRQISYSPHHQETISSTLLAICKYLYSCAFYIRLWLFMSMSLPRQWVLVSSEQVMFSFVSVEFSKCVFTLKENKVNTQKIHSTNQIFKMRIWKIALFWEGFTRWRWQIWQSQCYMVTNYFFFLLSTKEKHIFQPPQSSQIRPPGIMWLVMTHRTWVKRTLATSSPGL